MNAIASVGAQAKHFAASPVVKAVAITLGVYFLLMATQILPMFGITSPRTASANFLGGGFVLAEQTRDVQASSRYTHLLWGPLLCIALSLRFQARESRNQFLESIAIAALVSSFVVFGLIAMTAKGLGWASSGLPLPVLILKVVCLLPIAAWLVVWRNGLLSQATLIIVLCFVFLNKVTGFFLFLLQSGRFTPVQLVEFLACDVSLSLLGSSLLVFAFSKCKALLAADFKTRNTVLVFVFVVAWAVYDYVVLIFIKGNPVFFTYVHIGSWTSTTLGTGICIVWIWHISAIERLAQRERAIAQQTRLEAGLAEARGATLAAQIEPHFLFNTLANVLRLKNTSHKKGKLLLSSLIAYFDAALPRLRQDGASLHDELALVDAYLAILKLRMNERLTYSIDVPDDLRRLNFPPMMLLTLVENAYKHGLMRLPSGGSISITTRRHENIVRIVVADTGRGFQLAEIGGSGVGLSNIRARLQASFGHRATLNLAQGMPQGMVATLDIPVETR